MLRALPVAEPLYVTARCTLKMKETLRGLRQLDGMHGSDFMSYAGLYHHLAA